jgi:hypothetical protein
MVREQNLVLRFVNTQTRNLVISLSVAQIVGEERYAWLALHLNAILSVTPKSFEAARFSV